ncbi:Hyaluronan / mRNA binding family [Raphanus sativus]|nr:Hyaluronan / mRNA binding family [Raphanus sativus]
MRTVTVEAIDVQKKEMEADVGVLWCGTGHGVTEESSTVVEKNLAVEKDGEATDTNKDTPEITLEEYEKVLEEATKVEKRKVDTKAFEAMQQFSSKKSNNDEVFIKLGTEKDKRPVEKEEKTKKSLSINEFLKPANRMSYIGGYRGRESRVPREELIEEVVDQEEPTEMVGDQEETTGEGDQKAAAPKIEDAAQFPTLGK